MKGIRKVETAAIGCGAISHIHFEDMTNTLEILRVTGCYDLNRQPVEDMVATYDIPVLIIGETLEDSGTEIVTNLTNPTTYYGVIRNLLEHGKYAYTEKVLVTTFGQAQKLVVLAHEKRRLLYNTPDTFLGAAVQAARYLMESGAVGAVTSRVVIPQRSARLLTEKSPYTSRLRGSIRTDVGIYYTTAVVDILGEMKEVCGVPGMCTLEQPHCSVKNGSFGETYVQESETYLAGSLQFGNECMGILHFNSRSIRTERPYVAFYGTEGILFLEGPNFLGGDVKVILKGQAEPIVLPHIYGYDDDGKGLRMAEMAWALRKGCVPRTRANMALRSLKVLTGVIESRHTKRFYEMQTESERQPMLPGGYLGRTCTMNRPESTLALQEMLCKACSEDEWYPPSSGPPFWALRVLAPNQSRLATG